MLVFLVALNFFFLSFFLMEVSENQKVQLGYIGSAIAADDIGNLRPTDSFVGGLPVWLFPDPPPESLTRYVFPTIFVNDVPPRI